MSEDINAAAFQLVFKNGGRRLAVETAGRDGARGGKAAGKVKVEGRDYVIVEGDVMVVRFSV